MTRHLVKIIREIAEEQGYDFHAYSGDWILRIENGEKRTHVFGYNFELNPSAAQMIVQDKSAAAELLAVSGIPCVEHKLFMHPRLGQYYYPDGGNWQSILAYFHDNGNHIVAKPTTGTGGNNVYQAKNVLSLEQAVHTLFEKHRAIALSPYLEIEEEHRIILLDDAVFTVYYKDRPHVLGDGETVLTELIRRKYGGSPHLDSLMTFAKGERIPPCEEKVVLNWRHNLGQGALPVFEKDESKIKGLSDLACSAARTLNIRFASVDIVTVNGRHYVLEINSGVMGEGLTKHSQEGYQIMKAAYVAALKALLA